MARSDVPAALSMARTASVELIGEVLVAHLLDIGPVSRIILCGVVGSRAVLAVVGKDFRSRWKPFVLAVLGA